MKFRDLIKQTPYDPEDQYNDGEHPVDEAQYRVVSVTVDGETFKSGLMSKKDADDKHYKMTKVTDKRGKKVYKKIDVVKDEMNESVQQSLQAIVDKLMYAGNVTQAAHWNLRSANFISVHEWFGETYVALFAMADAVAEQIKIADINLMVTTNTNSVIPGTDEQELFGIVKNSLQNVKMALDAAASDATLSRPLHNLIDGWTADITKMIWFINASTKE